MSQPKIVVGIDDTPASRAALRWACAEAIAAGARLQVVHCRTGGASDLVHGNGTSADHHDLIHPAIAAATVAHPQLVIHGEVRTDRPAAALVRASTTAAMVVVGSHTRSGIETVLLGSTALEVVSRAACPVIVVPPDPPRHPGRFADHVVVGIDGSEESHTALEFGLAEAQLHDRPLAAVFVEHGNSADSYFDRDLLETIVEYAQPGREMLARMVEPLAVRYPQVHVKEALIPGRPLTGLMRVSAGAHLLVVGTRAHHALTGSRTGSTALALARRAECPVAVVHRPAAEIPGTAV
ncbi:MAG TPA: universal stress protein [Mycobacteriales bacterium]|nr:universal stress protein [Mycobacteriales bacterium]